MDFLQQPLVFECAGEALVAIVSRPRQPRSRGVIMGVGGPQYRVGSHRQFALLANHLAQQGTPVMRFDYRGMGDSSGAWESFEHVGPDLRAAIDAFFTAVPQLQEVVIWGLCDAASTAMFYAHQDQRVSGIVLLNPWARTVQGQAQTYLKHYYAERLFSPELWRKLCRGEFDFVTAARSLASNVTSALGAGRGARAPPEQTDTALSTPEAPAPLPDKMAGALGRFGGRVLLILSGQDLIAREFIDVTGASKAWRRLLANERVARRDLREATHTFSRREWRDQVATWTAEWVISW